MTAARTTVIATRRSSATTGETASRHGRRMAFISTGVHASEGVMKVPGSLSVEGTGLAPREIAIRFARPQPFQTTPRWTPTRAGSLVWLGHSLAKAIRRVQIPPGACLDV